MVKLPFRKKLKATTIMLDEDLFDFVDRIKVEERLRSRSAVIRQILQILKEVMEETKK